MVVRVLFGVLCVFVMVMLVVVKVLLVVVRHFVWLLGCC